MIRRRLLPGPTSRGFSNPKTFLIGIHIVSVALVAQLGLAQDVERSPVPTAASEADDAPRQARLDAAFSQMLSGAILEGSYTSTGGKADQAKLERDRYTLGEVKKVAGNLWLFPARIQYGEHDVTLPITLPVHWAGETAVIVVDNVTLPGFGAVSARVMFADNQYAGFWKHGKNGGHLFGVIQPAEKPAAERDPSPPTAPPSSSDAARDEQHDQ